MGRSARGLVAAARVASTRSSPISSRTVSRPRPPTTAVSSCSVVARTRRSRRVIISCAVCTWGSRTASPMRSAASPWRACTRRTRAAPAAGCSSNRWPRRGAIAVDNVAAAGRMRMREFATIDRRAATWGVVAVLVAVAIAVLGSGNLRWFDAALVGYLFGTLFAIFGVVYRYLVWLRRPPTAMLNRRGWEAFRRPGRRLRNCRRACRASSCRTCCCRRFIRGAIAKPLVRAPTRVLGLRARRAGDVPARVRAPALRIGGPARPPSTVRSSAASAPSSFDSRSFVGWVTFHLLDISAVLVLAGVFIFLAAPTPRSGRARDWSGRTTSSPWRACSRCRSPVWR